MERDVMIGHGMSQFLKERFMECSDKYSVHVCNECGLFASKKPNKNYWYCHACKNETDVSQVHLPYTCKLLFQELMSISIAPRIRVKKNIYNETV